MTAALQLANYTDQAGGAPCAAGLDWSMLMPASEAAPIMGKSDRQIRRLCAEQLAERGLAFHAAPPGGGKARWFVDRRADARLADGARAMVTGQASQLQHATEQQRRRAFARADCVRQFRELRESAAGSMEQRIPDLVEQLRAKYPEMRISRTTLFRWDRKMGSGGADGGVAALVDSPGGDQKSLGDGPAWQMFEQLYCDDRQPAITDCWKRVKIAARANGWAWCSERTCRRQLNRRITPERQLATRQPGKWRKQMQPTIDQNPEAWAAGQCIVGDHAQCDFLCWAGRSLVRAWATIWLCWRTRRVCGVLSLAPNSSTILAALRAYILDEGNPGPPRVAWVDGGRDYDAWTFTAQTKQQRLRKLSIEYDEVQFKGLFGLLDIEPHTSLAYNPNGKSRCEAWFRQMHSNFDRSFTSYVGNSPEARPESLKAVLDSPALAPTFAEAAEEFQRYLKASNARRDHQIEDLCDPRGMIPLSPDEAMQQWAPSRRVLADPAALDLLLQIWHRPVKLTRRGVVIAPFGQRLAYGGMDPALSHLKALKAKDRPTVRVSYDPADLSRVRVYSEQFRFITEARLNETGGGSKISQEQLKELMKRKRQYAKAIKTVESNRELEYLTAAEVLTLSQPDPATAPKPRQSSIDQSLTVVETPLDGQAKDLQRDQMRQAAGAEHDATPAGGGGGGQRRGYDRLFSRLQDFADNLGPAPARPDPWARFHAAEEARAVSPSDFFETGEEGGGEDE